MGKNAERRLHPTVIGVEDKRRAKNDGRAKPQPGNRVPVAGQEVRCKEHRTAGNGQHHRPEQCGVLVESNARGWPRAGQAP